MDLEKAFDNVERTKMMKVLKNNEIDWKKRRLIANLHWGKQMKVNIGRELSEFIHFGREVRQ